MGKKFRFQYFIIKWSTSFVVKNVLIGIMNWEAEREQTGSYVNYYINSNVLELPRSLSFFNKEIQNKFFEFTKHIHSHKCYTPA